MSARTYALDLLPVSFAICRLEPDAPLPHWCDALPFCSIARTDEELSIICPEQLAPHSVHADRGWSAFKLRGPFAFDEIGVLAGIAQPLAAAGISIMAISTFDTDYILVPGSRVREATAVFEAEGHIVYGNTG